MNVTLTADLAKFVNKKLKDGPYGKASDVVCEALRQFQQRDRAGIAGSMPNQTWPTLGSYQGEDIESVAFIVLMEATKSANEDLKMIMAEVKAMTAAKAKLRDLISTVNKDVSANAGQKDKLPPLDFSTGMGTQEAYHDAPMPVPDPGSTGGVKFIPTNLYNGQLDDVAELRAILDDLKGQLDSMNEMSEMTSLRLQMMMDRRSKFVSTLSNIMKKLSNTQDSLVQNLK